MAMLSSDIRTPLGIVVEEQIVFTLSALCRASGAQAEQVHALIDEGLLQPTGQQPEDWQFSGSALRSTRMALRLARDLELAPSGVVLVMGLLGEIERLQAQLRRR
jgi:chaperone modulatory protein CbpM